MQSLYAESEGFDPCQCRFFMLPSVYVSRAPTYAKLGPLNSHFHSHCAYTHEVDFRSATHFSVHK